MLTLAWVLMCSGFVLAFIGLVDSYTKHPKIKNNNMFSSIALVMAITGAIIDTFINGW